MCFGKERQPTAQALCEKSHFISQSDRGMTQHWGSQRIVDQSRKQRNIYCIYSAGIKTEPFSIFNIEVTCYLKGLPLL